MILESQDYRVYLKAVLAERTQRNPSYSIRAFAKSMELSPSFLAQVLRGKRHLSVENSKLIGNKLGLNSAEQEYFSLVVQLESAKRPELKSLILGNIQAINPILKTFNVDVDEFKLIADWYHMAIYFMADMKNFSLDPKSVRSRLGITEDEAAIALHRLERLQLLKRAEDGSWIRTQKRLMIASSTPSTALRQFHKQMLERAIDSLETQTPQEKYIGSETFAISPSQLKEISDEINLCFDKIVAIVSRPDQEKSEIYHLGIQCFRLTRRKKK